MDTSPAPALVAACCLLLAASYLVVLYAASALYRSPVLAPVTIRSLVLRQRLVMSPGDSCGAVPPARGWTRWELVNVRTVLAPGHWG